MEPATMASLETVIPGWDLKLVTEAVEKVRRGVALEQARLAGSQFLTVVRIHELNIDGITDRFEIGSGFNDLGEAQRHAQWLLLDRVMKETRQLDPEQRWRAEPASRKWPWMAPMEVRVVGPVFQARTTDGTGWNALEVSVAVLPTNPALPVNIEVIRAMAQDSYGPNWSEAACWFIGRASGTGV